MAKSNVKRAAEKEVRALEEVRDIAADLTPLLARLKALRPQLGQMLPIHIDGLVTIAGNLSDQTERQLVEANRVLDADNG